MKWLVNQKDLNFSPGEEYLYSNSGYWLLGQIVNKVSGENMAEFAQKEIFEPLGMSNTHFHNDHTKIVKNRASGYVPNGKGSYQISMTTLDMIGDGGIFTSIEDIKKWDDAFYDSKVLSKNFWSTMTKQGVLINGKVLEYASGLSISTYKGIKTVSHAGGFVGFRADLIRFPKQRFSVAIFTNRGDANPTAMGYRVADIFLKDEYKDNEIQNVSPKEKSKNKFIKLKFEELDRFSGYYWNSQSFYSRRIYVKNDTLRYSRSQTNESDLIPISKTEFNIIGVGTDVIVKFDKNEKDINTMSFIVNGGDPIVSVAYEAANYTIEALKIFSGTYYSKELDVSYTLKMKDNTLLLYINDNEISPVTLIMEDVLSNDKYGTFLFQKDTLGNISNFSLAAGRVKNIKFEKKLILQLINKHH